MSSPSRRTVPDRTGMSPTATRSNVVFPAPLWPMMAAPPPTGIATSTSNRTIVREYPAVTPTISSRGSAIERDLRHGPQVDLLDLRVGLDLADRPLGQHL